MSVGMTESAEAAQLAHKTWRTLEPLHGMIYFVPEAAEAYARLGVTGTAGYFASRAAPMGAVAADVVIATFFNFNPELVRAAIPGAWDLATPEDLVEARFAAVDAAFRRILGDAVVGSPEMAPRGRAGPARRRTRQAVTSRVARSPRRTRSSSGRTSRICGCGTPSRSCREFRGDGHIALLVVHGLSGLEALVTHAAAGDVPGKILRATRAWSDEAWRTAVDALRGRGWLEPGDELRFTATGTKHRQEIEDGTDELAATPYAALGEERCAELRALVRPWSKVFTEHLR